ncbi:Protein FAM208B [Lonchura striata]|uniref:Protein FAM208B n=1 Tax=Lonchura striata TaxID=40157 RepID=A0A218U734_9PASE|nr:Protein FAM208B [Lonchura striata domestica]
MGLSDLRKKLPEAAFGKKNYTGNEVCFQGVYSSLYEVEISKKDQSRMDQLVENLVEKDLAIIKYLQDQGVLILLTSSALAREDGLEPKEPVSLLALFLFRSPRALSPREEEFSAPGLGCWLDTRYTNDPLEKCVVRALHGPWDPDLPDDVEGMKLILHMWVALFYRKPSKLLSSSRKVVEHSNPRKFVSISSSGGFLELSDDSQDCFGLETCPADSGSDAEQIPSSSLDASSPSQPQKGPADSRADAAGAVDSTVSSSSGELPCGDEEEPSSTSCPESLSLLEASREELGGAGREPEDIPEEDIPEESIPEEEEAIPEEAIPEESVPEESVPEESVPEESVPEESVPEEAIPEEAIPEESIPEESIPEESIPKEAIPKESIPEEAIPEEEEAIPEEAIPEESIPEESIPEEAIPEEEEAIPEEEDAIPEEEDAIPKEAIPEEDMHNVSSVTTEEPAQEELVDARITPSPRQELGCPSKSPDAPGTEKSGSRAPNSSTAPRTDPPSAPQEKGEQQQQEKQREAGSGSGPGPPEDEEATGGSGHSLEVEDGADPHPARDSTALEADPGNAEPGGGAEEGQESQEPAEPSEKEERVEEEEEEEKEENEELEDESPFVGPVGLVLSESSDAEMECEQNPGNSASPEEFGAPEEDPMPSPTSLAPPCPDRSSPAPSDGAGTDPGCFPEEMSPNQEELPDPWDAPGTPDSEADGLGAASPAEVGSPHSHSGELPVPPEPGPVRGAQPHSVTHSPGAAGAALGSGSERRIRDRAASGESSACPTSPDGSVHPEDGPVESAADPDPDSPDAEEPNGGRNGVLLEEQQGSPSGNGTEELDDLLGAGGGRDSPFGSTDVGDDFGAEESEDVFPGAGNSPGNGTTNTEMPLHHRLLESEPSSSVSSVIQELPRQERSFPNIHGDSAPASPAAGHSDPGVPAVPGRRSCSQELLEPRAPGSPVEVAAQPGSAPPSPCEPAQWAGSPAWECPLCEPWDVCEHSPQGSQAFDPDCAEVGQGEIPASPVPWDEPRDLSGENLEDILDLLPSEEQLPSQDTHEDLAFEDPLENSFGGSEQEYFEGNSHSPLPGTCIMRPVDAAGARTPRDISSRSSVRAARRGEAGAWPVPGHCGSSVVTGQCQERVEPSQLPRRHGRRAQESHLARALTATWRDFEEITQNTLDMECLRFHYKLKEILRKGRAPFSTSQSIFPAASSPRSRSPLQVTVPSSAAWHHGDAGRRRAGSRERAAPARLGKPRYERAPPEPRGAVAGILEEFSEFQRLLPAGSGRAGAARPRGAAAIRAAAAELRGALRCHLRRVAAGGRPGMFYLLETGKEPFFDRAKALLKAQGFVRTEPPDFGGHRGGERLLVIVRNEDIASHIHTVPCLLELKRCPSVVFAGVDDPEEVTADTFQELFQAGGFVVSDEELLERVTLGQLKEVVKVLEKLNRSGRWKWLLHHSESKKLRGDLRDAGSAQKKRLLLRWCQGAELLEPLPFHGCDAAGRRAQGPPQLQAQCLLQLQAQRVRARFAVYLTVQKSFGAFRRHEKHRLCHADTAAPFGPSEKPPGDRKYFHILPAL